MYRSWRSVPLALRMGFIIGFGMQLLWGAARPGQAPATDDLPPAWSATSLRVLSGGEESAAGKITMLWLQSFDVQSGQSLALRELDYPNLIAWFQTILELDNRSQYVLQSAARIYAEVSDTARSRQVLEWLHHNYAADPERRWPWLAHAAVLAKHRLHDQQLALKYATTLADTPNSKQIPAWARQMQWTLLEEQGELATLRLLIGGLLTSGQITDQVERRFINSMLERIERKTQLQIEIN